MYLVDILRAALVWCWGAVQGAEVSSLSLATGGVQGRRSLCFDIESQSLASHIYPKELGCCSSGTSFLKEQGLAMLLDRLEEWPRTLGSTVTSGLAWVGDSWGLLGPLGSVDHSMMYICVHLWA